MSLTFEQESNGAQSTLNGGITSSATSLTVVSASGFPTTGNFRILVDSEWMLVTAVSSNTFTVTRGIEGSSAISHNSGATVSQILTAGGLAQLMSDRVISNTSANKPAAAVSGRLYLPTDDNKLQYDTGSAWVPLGPGPYQMSPVPASSSFTANNQGTATATWNDSTVIVQGPTSAADAIHSWEIAIPTEPFHITIAFQTLADLENGGMRCGLVMRSSGDNCATIEITEWLDGGVPVAQLASNEFTSSTTYSSSIVSPHRIRAMDLYWLRVRQDSTNFYFDISRDGVNWINWSTKATNTFPATYNKIGFFIDAFTGEGYWPPVMMLHSWQQGS